jgi:hypothetical protein
VISDLRRFGDWVPTHERWIGDVPHHLDVGTTISGEVTVFSMIHTVEWTVIEHAPPTRLALHGTLVADLEVGYTVTVETTTTADAMVTLGADITGAVLNGAGTEAIDRAVARELRISLAGLTDLLGTLPADMTECVRDVGSGCAGDMVEGGRGVGAAPGPMAQSPGSHAEPSRPSRRSTSRAGIQRSTSGR